MPYTEEHTKESLSKAYVTAIAGMAGVLVGDTNLDYGVDGTLISVVERSSPETSARRFIQSPFRVDYQLKATTTWTINSETNEIVYDLEAKNYNDMLAREEDDGSIVLLLLCLPNEQSDWLNVCNEQLVMKNCCYWYKAVGNATNNASTKRIKIPSSNVLTVEALLTLLNNEKSRRMGGFHE